MKSLEELLAHAKEFARPDNLYFLVRYQVLGVFQRAWRGWADKDVWNMDALLARQQAGMFRRLAKVSHSYPSHFKTFDDWREWLLAKAEWFEWYANAAEGKIQYSWLDDNIDKEEAQRRLDAFNHKINQFFSEVLVDYSRHFKHLWD